MADLPVVAARTDPTTTDKPKRKYTKNTPRSVPLPDGDMLIPRAMLVKKYGITERTATNNGWPVAYIGNVAFCPKNKVAALVASRVRYAPEPSKPRRRR